MPTPKATPTPNHNLNRPDAGALDWDVPVNANFDTLDLALPPTGGSAGQVLKKTTDNDYETEWADESGGGGGGGPLPPIGDSFIIGGINGLLYSKAAPNGLTITAGNCYDSLGTTVLEAAAEQAITVPTDASTVYNLFLCDDGIVRVDTDVDGANITNLKRWIGFVLTDPAGELESFTMSPTNVYFGIGGGGPVVTVLTESWTIYDVSNAMPLKRSAGASFGHTQSSVNMYIGDDIEHAIDVTAVNETTDLHSVMYGISVRVNDDGDSPEMKLSRVAILR